MTSVSVIIPTHNRAKRLERTLKILVEQKYEGKWEILVVDNASEDETEKTVKRLIDDNPSISIKYIYEKNLGLHYARNTGGLEAIGNIIIYLDDDMDVEPDWLLSMANVYENDGVGCAGGKIVPDWEVDPPPWVRLFHPGFLGIIDLGRKNRELSWPQDIYGGNLSIRKSVFLKVKGFNPDGFADQSLIWFRGDGETGLIKKVYDCGYKVLYVANAVSNHWIPKESMVPQFFFKRALKQGISDNFTYYRKHKPSKLKLIFRSLLFSYRAWYKRFAAVIVRDNNLAIRCKGIAAYLDAISKHSYILSKNDELCKFVLKPDFIDFRGIKRL